jgi:hypothetical protein
LSISTVMLLGSNVQTNPIKMKTPHTIETIITSADFSATVEYGGGQIGVYARVDDAQHPANGEYAYASTPDLAIALLIDKIRAQETKNANA